MPAKRMFVKAIAGALLLLGAWGSVSLRAGEEKTVPAAPAAQGRIEAGKPVYRAKKHKAWKHKGRIVGRVRNAPAFEITALDSDGKVVASAKVEGKAKAYELQWLKPGVYTLRVSAKGYKTLEIKGLEVRAGHDLLVDLEFTAGTAKGEPEPD